MTTAEPSSSDEAEVIRNKLLTPEEVKLLIALRERVKSSNPLSSLSDDSPPLREQIRRLEGAHIFTRQELAGVLKSEVDFGKAVWEKVVSVSQQQGGIEMAIKHHGKSRVPWTMLIILAMGISVIGMFTLVPDYGRSLGAWLSKDQNQLVFGAILIVVILVAYFFTRRRRRQPSQGY